MGIAALAATFWLLVATVRLVLYPPAPQVAPTAPAPFQVDPPGPSKSKVSEDDCCRCRADDISTPSRVREGGGGGPSSKTALVNGLNAVRPSVQACYERYQVPGTAMVNVVIAKSGRVSSAQVTGKFAETPTGRCVEQAVMTARFPASDGFRTPFPFQLR